jgi:hypothetical protein
MLCAQGVVSVSMDPRIGQVIEDHKIATAEARIKGFRVQLCSESGNNAKAAANAQKAAFLRQYPGMAAYLIWESPNFKVRIGDFKTRLDATLFWKQIQSAFPESYVVMDEIKPMKLD